MIYQLVKFFMVYMTTLIAFGMVLFVLLAKDEEVFDNPWTSFLKVLIMMIGEYDFADSFTFTQISDDQVVSWQIIEILTNLSVLYRWPILVWAEPSLSWCKSS